MKASSRTAHDITVSRTLRAKGSLRALCCALALFTPGLAGCSQQEEGERCDPANLNADCDTGLSCVSLSSLHRGSVGGVCCPDSNASADVCLQVDFSGDETSAEPEAETETPSSETLSSATSASEASATETESSTVETSNSEPVTADAGTMSDAGKTSEGTADAGDSGVVAVDGGK
jgi:hypothetical protein